MSYVFEGDRVKINQSDYQRFLKLYPKLDLLTELEQLDVELREATNKSWFMTLNAKLNYRNKVAKTKPGQVAITSNNYHGSDRTRDRTIKQQLDDTSWAN